MTTNKTNQPTTDRNPDQIMKDLELARLMQEPVHIDRLTDELKQAINKAFTPATTHQATQDTAEAVQALHAIHNGQEGGIILADTNAALEVYFTSDPPNMLGRMCLVSTRYPIEQNPVTLAACITSALDQDSDDDSQDPTNPESDHAANRAAAAAVQEAREALRAESNRLIKEQRTIDAAQVDAIAEEAERNAAKCAEIIEAIKADDRAGVAAYDSPREYVDNPRTYETTTLALELENIEPLYTAARAAIKAARTLGHQGFNDADALEAYVADILENQDTTNPRTAVLVALANAATARIDWSDVAAQLIEVDEISEDDLEAAAAMMDKYNHTEEQ